MKLKDIKPNPNNPRVLRDEKFQKLKQSITEFPKMLSLRPMVIDENNVVLGGNMRLRALQELGFTDIDEAWVKRSSDLTEDEKKRFIIADNVAFGEWDWDTLANDWEVVDLEAWGLEIPQFDNEAEELEASEDDYDVPEGGIETDIVIGDLFEIGEHRLLCGDSTDSDAVARLMNGEKADMVFTDPPYGISVKNKIGTIKNDDSLNVFRDSMPQIYMYTKIPSHIYIWCSSTLIIESGTIFCQYFDLKNIIPSINTNLTTSVPKYHFRHNYEPCLFGMIGEREIGVSDRIKVSESTVNDSRYKGNGNLTVYPSLIPELKCSEPNNGLRLHPTMKKVDTICFYIDVSSIKGEIILDLFLGSGSTMVAAHQLKRRCYGMELEPKYCQVIIDRMAKLDPSLKITRNGKEYKTV